MARLKNKLTTKHPGIDRKPAQPFTPEQRRHHIETAAYYIAEQRGFSDGGALEDWLKAEQEIDRWLASTGEGGDADGFVAKQGTFLPSPEGKASSSAPA